MNTKSQNTKTIIKIEITNEIDFYVLEKAIRHYKNEIERSIERGEKDVLKTEWFSQDQIDFEKLSLKQDKTKLESILSIYNQILKTK